MSNPTPVPAGWYPDPSGAAQSRWWDGTQWLDATQALPYVAAPAYTAVPYSADATPSGVDTNTVHIWILVALPLVSIIPFLFFDWNGYMRSAMDPATAATAVFSPSYLALLAISWGTYFITALFAFLDWRALKQRIDRPFHFAWVFLYSPIYMIGRPIVARSRAGSGLGVIWAYIASLVIATVIAGIVVFSQMATLFSDPSLLSGY